MNTLLSCVYFFSFLNNVDPQLTIAVAQVESSNNTMAISPDKKDYGLLQIRQKYVPYSKRQLLNGCTNVMAGTEILGRLKKECKLCVDKVWQNRYNLGLSGERKLKHPLKWKYSRKIAAVMERK